MIMVSHLSCTQFADGTTLPASMNPSIINGLLRGQLGYDGLVITDALQMGAVSGVTCADRQGALVIHAGGDLILMPVNFNQAYDGLLAAVRSGEISEARINESVRRVIHAKNTI
jgi:beta-N-acetylhexosaminidase